MSSHGSYASRGWLTTPDAVLAQTLASRAYRALNRVCVGKARHVRFKSKGRGLDSIGLDLGPASLAIVPREAEANLVPLCAELRPDVRAMRRLQRKMERQRRAANPEHYDERDRPKKHGKGAPRWKESRSYQATRRRKATRERRLAAHRKSLLGRMVHQIVAVGNTVITEKLSYKAWQKRYGKSVGHCAPGMFIDHLRRTVAKTGGTLHEVSTRYTKLSQFCHGCGRCVPKPLSQRWHQCPCGIGPVQRDLYSAFLAAFLDPVELSPSCAQYVVPSGRCGGAPVGSTRASYPTRE